MPLSSRAGPAPSLHASEPRCRGAFIPPQAERPPCAPPRMPRVEELPLPAQTPDRARSAAAAAGRSPIDDEAHDAAAAPRHGRPRPPRGGPRPAQAPAPSAGAAAPAPQRAAAAASSPVHAEYAKRPRRGPQGYRPAQGQLDPHGRLAGAAARHRGRSAGDPGFPSPPVELMALRGASHESQSSPGRHPPGAFRV